VFANGFLVATHIFADMAWIGSIATVGALIVKGGPGTLQSRAAIARWAYLRLAAPAFVVAFITGLALLAADPSHSLLKIPSMHVKLTLAAGVIGLHHWFGALARRMATGDRQVPMNPIPLALLLSAACGAAFLGVLKPF